MLRSEEKKVTGDDQPSSAPAINTSDACVVAASFTKAAAMDDIERRLRIVLHEAAWVYENRRQSLMRERQTIRGICCGSAGGAVWGCCVCLRCGAFSDAFGSLLVPVGTKSGSKRIFAMVDVNVFPSIYDLFGPSMQIWRSQQSRRVVVTLDDEVMGRGVTVCEVGKSVEKEM